jgi:hypothetical protein
MALSVLVGFGLGRSTCSALPGNAPVVSESATRGTPPHTVEQFRAALREHDPAKRSRGLVEFLDDFGPNDVDETIQVLEANRIGVVEYEMKLIMFSWTRFDPAAALAWARADDWGKPGMSERVALFTWGFHDPHGAIANLQEREQYKPDSKLVDAVVTGWSRNGDLQGVTDFLIAMPPSRSRSMLANNLVALISNSSIDAAIAWADAVPVDAPGQFKRVAYMRTMSAVGQRDPERAMRWYEDHRGDEYTETALDILARRYVEYHVPSAFFIWLQELPPIPVEFDATERAGAIAVGFRAWLRRDEKNATSWLEDQAILPRALDPAVAEMARHLSRHPRHPKPRMAIAWAERIQDPEFMRKTIVPIARNWQVANPEEMQAWLSASDLPQDLRTEILTPKKKPARTAVRASPVRQAKPK